MYVTALDQIVRIGQESGLTENVAPARDGTQAPLARVDRPVAIATGVERTESNGWSTQPRTWSFQLSGVHEPPEHGRRPELATNAQALLGSARAPTRTWRA